MLRMVYVTVWDIKRTLKFIPTYTHNPTHKSVIRRPITLGLCTEVQKSDTSGLLDQNLSVEVLSSKDSSSGFSTLRSSFLGSLTVVTPV